MAILTNWPRYLEDKWEIEKTSPLLDYAECIAFKDDWIKELLNVQRRWKLNKTTYQLYYWCESIKELVNDVEYVEDTEQKGISSV